MRDIEIDETLVERVMKENLWTKEYTMRVIEEYKKFLKLTLTYEVAPSYEIDQVWHTHILYTRDYRITCKNLGMDYIDHNPVVKGGWVKADPYPNTKKVYEKVYGKEPPKDIWTDWKKSHYSYIDLTQYHAVQKGDIKTMLKVLLRTIFK